MLEATKWEIIHIHNELDSSLEVPTVEVLASNIEPKLANSIVRRTSQGKVELSVILCLADEHEKDTEAVPIGIQPLSEPIIYVPLEQNDIFAGVSCLNPWGWSARELVKQNSLVKRENKFTWHPLRHAAVVAIENAAERDRKLFPNSEVLKSKSEALDVLLHTADERPSKRQKIEEHIIDKEVLDSLKPTKIMRPYLCTGFDIYLVCEPCPMCAMALVHQRIRRIFYALPNPKIGALGSVYRLQGEKSLNHHYSVFRISVPEQDLEELIRNTPDSTSQC